LAVGDLNGDGIPDIVVQPPSIAGSTPGFAVYAGIGDGTFQTTPLFAESTLPQNTAVISALIGDVNADGHPDLLVETQDPTSSNAIVSVYLGDGKGNFTTDSNTYTAGLYNQDPSMVSSPIAVFARLNNNAPALPGDSALDYLTFTSGGATSLLNQSNPKPSAPLPLTSTLTISSNPVSAAPTQPIAFSASVKGISPSGTITFTSGNTTLGTASVGLITTVNAAFPAEGTYTVSAVYSGDSNNQQSSSAPISVTVARIASTTLLGVDTLTPGTNQIVNFLVNFSGYSPTGTVNFLLADGSSLGTAQAVNGQAHFAYVFPIAGTYSVHASYAGDVANLPSVSAPLTVTAMVPDFYFSAPGNQATFPAGQSATTTFTIMPNYGYSGTVKFSCSSLLAGETCTFTPPTVRSADGFSAVTSAFVISTTAPTSAAIHGLFKPLQGITWASLLGLIFFRKRIRQAYKPLVNNSLLALMLAFSLLQLAACSSSSPSSTPPPTQTGTPKGTQTIVITAADTSGSPSHTFNVQLTIE
jgi:hypothetical protein